ncbi:uncharacterized protein LOC123692522 [Colias croceus]|uniref:uncharacterized protein LOC123692522 n=1 Tax=Colias crocea TaxID=72248 RepID=UPI001E27A68E|nr:uncharacterized protein LOC123692522 [Colias croceus]XP_045493238.1 uncharacterized protein LOC123692522 [Colias croceus]CAG4937334.1 unnamed protein product [Colias eurytheme]
MSERLEAGQQLVKKTMDQVIQEKKSTGAVSIQARQEFRESYQESYEEEFEEETFIDQHGNATTKRVESSSESKEHSKSADVRVKASGLNAEQMKALTDCANEAGQLALDSKAAN